MARNYLKQNTVFYVRPDGNDTNSGLSNTSAGAFATVQRAVNYVSYNVDQTNYIVTIQLASGSYDETVSLPSHIGWNNVTISGSATPGEVVVKSVYSDNSRRWVLKDLELNNPAGAYCVAALNKGTLLLNNVQFNQATTTHIWVLYGGRVAFQNDYRIVGNAPRHMLVQFQGVVRMSSLNCALIGSRAFSAYFIGASLNSMIRATGFTFTGTATGIRYNSAANSLITGTGASATYFPGNAAGSTSEGGQYS
jgi:hypothetical protein